MDFAMSQASIADDTYPLLWNIQVVDLRPSLLALYARTVPRSVVSPICAVPISDLSDFPDEAEVLLRGPFFQLLGLRTEKVSDGREIFVLDVVMVTANRDHVSSVSLSDHETDRARNLFRTMVELERAERCVAYATQHGLTSDAEAYTVSSRQLQARLGEFDE
jgi:hypothetical protein